MELLYYTTLKRAIVYKLETLYILMPTASYSFNQFFVLDLTIVILHHLGMKIQIKYRMFKRFLKNGLLDTLMCTQSSFFNRKCIFKLSSYVCFKVC